MANPKIATTPTLVVDFYNLKAETIAPSLRELTPPGVLTMIEPAEMPAISDHALKEWIDTGHARVGGLNNTSGPLARLGLESIAIGNLGAGRYGNFDPQGKFTENCFELHGIKPVFRAEVGVQSGTTFVVGGREGERPGIIYAPNANKRIDLRWLTEQLEKQKPDVAHFMYLGLSGQAVDRDLPGYLRHWRENLGCIVAADTHTLMPAANRNVLTRDVVNPHLMLPYILPQLNVFFCSLDEARLIWKAFRQDEDILPAAGDVEREQEFVPDFLNFLSAKAGKSLEHRLVLGVTQKERVWLKEGESGVTPVENRFLVKFQGGNLVGAGDAFRAGLLGAVAVQADDFRSGRLDMRDAIAMGNVVATLAISGPAAENERFNQLPKDGWERLMRVVRSEKNFTGSTMDALLSAVERA